MSVPPVVFPTLCVQVGIPPVTGWWVAPFGHLRITVCMATPRSLSQPCRALPRLLAPRHPPHTHNILTTQLPALQSARSLSGQASSRQGAGAQCSVKTLATCLDSLVKEPSAPSRCRTAVAREGDNSGIVPPGCPGCQPLFGRLFPRSLVEMSGLEPPTSALQRPRSPS